MALFPLLFVTRVTKRQFVTDYFEILLQKEKKAVLHFLDEWGLLMGEQDEPV
jgi:hypothetical protein